MPKKFKSTAFVLCFLLGMLSAHRFYLGRKRTALAQCGCALGGMALFIAGLVQAAQGAAPRYAALMLLGGCLALVVWCVWWLLDKVLLIADRLKDADGHALIAGAPDPSRPQAGFWVRFSAFVTDYVIVGFAGALLTYALIVISLLVFGSTHHEALFRLLLQALLEPQQIAGLFDALSPGALAGLILTSAVPSTLVGCLYYTLLTASAWQGTIGKRAFGIYVTTTDGRRITLRRSLARYGAFLLACLPMYLGLLPAAFTRERRALQDYLAGTCVLHLPVAMADTTRAADAARPGDAPHDLPETLRSAAA